MPSREKKQNPLRRAGRLDMKRPSQTHSTRNHLHLVQVPGERTPLSVEHQKVPGWDRGKRALQLMRTCLFSKASCESCLSCHQFLCTSDCGCYSYLLFVQHHQSIGQSRQPCISDRFAPKLFVRQAAIKCRVTLSAPVANIQNIKKEALSHPCLDWLLFFQT